MFIFHDNKMDNVFINMNMRSNTSRNPDRSKQEVI